MLIILLISYPNGVLVAAAKEEQQKGGMTSYKGEVINEFTFSRLVVSSRYAVAKDDNSVYQEPLAHLFQK